MFHSSAAPLGKKDRFIQQLERLSEDEVLVRGMQNNISILKKQISSMLISHL